MYPEGFSTSVIPGGPALAGLEDRFRPDHFPGVAQVVAKLLNQAQADCAFFGEKDFQQLAVIRRMAADLDIPTRIFGGPTLREADGLAMSSRNVYLDAAEREKAPLLARCLRECAQKIGAGENPAAAAAQKRRINSRRPASRSIISRRATRKRSRPSSRSRKVRSACSPRQGWARRG